MGRNPDFVILGAQKAGTTSLYDLLSRHPRVAAATAKELHFLDRHWERGAAWYREQFVAAEAEPGLVTGEATPYYLFHPDAPQRLARVAPEARLLVVLRDPVKRAYSHYQMQVRHGREDCSFRRALALETQRLAVRPGNRPRYSYRARGRYAEQIERWLGTFERDRFLFVESSALFRDTERTLRRITGFLDLPPYPAGTSLPKRGVSRYSPMPSDLRRDLSAYFAPHDERLRALLGEPFSWNAPRVGAPGRRAAPSADPS